MRVRAVNRGIWGFRGYSGEQQCGKLSNTCSKTGVLTMQLPPFHPKIDDRTATTASKTMPKIFLLVDTNTHCCVVVEGAVTAILGVQVKIVADKSLDAYTGFEALRNRSVGRGCKLFL